MSQLPLRAQLASAARPYGRDAVPGGRARRRIGDRRQGRPVLDPDLLRQLGAGPQARAGHRHQRQDHHDPADRRGAAALGEVATNALGANMPDRARLGAGPAPDAPLRRARGRREVPARRCWTATGPRVVALLNLSRDQLDRAAEIWHAGRAVARGAGRHAERTRDRQRRRPAGGLGRRHRAAERRPGSPPGQRWHDDSWCCPECGGRAAAPRTSDWRCGECGFRRPGPSWVLDGDRDRPARAPA